MADLNAPSSARIAFFDMDKTLLRAHSARLFTQYRRRRGELSRLAELRVGYWLLQYSLGILDAEKVARLALEEYAGTEEEALRSLCEKWIEEEVLSLVAPQAKARVEEHRKAGDWVAVATSSTPYGTDPVARSLQIEHVLCTELEVEAGRFTGRVVEPLCFGDGKRRRAQEFAERHGLSLDACTFYTDSITDLPLLCAVGSPVVVNPDARLRREAKRRGWTMEDWM